MDVSIEQFVERLIQEKGIGDVPDAVLQQLKADLQERAEDMINAEILAHMPPEALSTFEEMLDTSTDEDVQAFCREKIPNLDAVIGQALLSLQQLYVGSNA